MHTIIHCEFIDPALLNAFLREAFPQKMEKVAFLEANGAWLHHGNVNRYVMLDETERMLGYCAVIPSRVLQSDGTAADAVWWIDLIILPALRGQGLQTAFDDLIRNLPQHKLGFPNAFAAQIHKKHQWGVVQSGSYMTLTLFPRRTAIQGMLSAFLRRRSLRRHQAIRATRLEHPDNNILAGTFMRHNKSEGLVTTYRDAEYIQWRFLDAPYAKQLAFYITGSASKPEQVLVMRFAQSPQEARILDVWGDFSNYEALEDLIRTAAIDALQRGCRRVLALASHPNFMAALLKIGFEADLPRLFCWYASPTDQYSLLEGRYHWTLADADNDTVG